MYITKEFPSISVGNVGMMVNFLVYAICFFLFDIEIVIYSLIYGVVFALACDKVHVQNICVKVLIFTKEEGIDFITSTDVGRDITAEELKQQYDAVVLCCGAKQPRDIGAPGRDAAGIHFAVDYLSSVTKSLLDSNFADGRAITAEGKKVLVIGGGDTGNDCVGTAIRQGCTGVTQLEMMPCPPVSRAPGNDWPEWPRVLKTDYGQQEAIAKFGSDPRLYKTTVKEFYKNESGQVCGALIAKLESQVVDGRRMMVPTGEEFAVECDLVLIAAGFTGCESYVSEAFGVDIAVFADEEYAHNRYLTICNSRLRPILDWTSRRNIQYLRV